MHGRKECGFRVHENDPLALSIDIDLEDSKVKEIRKKHFESVIEGLRAKIAREEKLAEETKVREEEERKYRDEIEDRKSVV